MNSNIKDKQIKTSDGDIKKHQAYAMELSRLKEAQKKCVESKNCFEYNRLGGDSRMNEVKTLVDNARKVDELRRKTQKDTNPNNTYQKEKDPTEVGVPNLSREANHNGGEKHKKINTKSSLSEGLYKEISEIRYLIEYMNNNKKQNL